jgi:hypothetical protein
MGGILSSTPLDFVDLLLNFEGLKIIEFGFVRLEFGMEFVLASFFLRLSAHLAMVHTMMLNKEVSTVSFLSNSTTRPPLSPVAR